MDNLWKVHEYSRAKSFGRLLSDIGGHLGLFLGWNCFTLVNLMQGWITERMRLRKEAKAVEEAEDPRELIEMRDQREGNDP